MKSANDISMALNEDNREYIEKHKLMLYVEDAISQFLAYRQNNPKVKPAKFLREYFRSVKQGNHVLFREYTFIMSSAHNWNCAKDTLGRVLHTFHNEMGLSLRDYHSVICLLFKEFPFYVTNDIISSLFEKQERAKPTQVSSREETEHQY